MASVEATVFLVDEVTDFLAAVVIVDTVLEDVNLKVAVLVAGVVDAS